jgi:hypothetical protein
MWRRKARNRMSGNEKDVLNSTSISHSCLHRASVADGCGRYRNMLKSNLIYRSFLKSLCSAFSWDSF